MCATLTRGADGRPLPGMELAGGRIIAERGLRAVVPNITPDLETGIGRWSDAEIAAAIRDGRRPDGTLIGPPMPIELYRGLSDHDLVAIVAYLRAALPVQHEVTERSTYPFPLTPYGPPVANVLTRPRMIRWREAPTLLARRRIAWIATRRRFRVSVATGPDRRGRCSFRGSVGRGGRAQHLV
jgi:hypothetical protein